MTSPFQQIEEHDYIENPNSGQKNPFKSPFEQIESDSNALQQTEEEQEEFWKSSLRSVLQIPQGIAEVSYAGMGTAFWQFIAGGELGHEELDHLKQIYEREGKEFPEEEFEQAKEDVMAMIPTVRNLARMAEERTGIPLEPKTRFQKGVRFLTEATKLSPSGATLRPLNVGLPKPVLGAGLEATREVLKEAGVPEPFDELLSFAMLKHPSEGAPKLTIGKKTKPSGLTERKYENLKEPTEVSPEKIEQINTKVENEFRDIASDIIEKSPVSETYSALKNDIEFKSQARESFKDVQSLADELPTQLDTKDLKKNIVDRVAQKKGTGFLPSEYDKIHKKYIKQFITETPSQKITTGDLVTQYRKNNEALGQAFEPGQSFAYNRGKREALLDYNRSIADIIKKEFPDSEFANLFESTNKTWASIMDAEAIDKFMDGLFSGKIKFEKGKDFFDKQGMTVPFKRALGKEGFNDFQTLVKDLMSIEQANKFMRKAKVNGFNELAKSGMAYLVHPHLGAIKFAHSAGKYGYRKLWEMMLDKPQFAVTWHKGIENLKKGNFAKAEETFETLKKAEKAYEPKESVKPTEVINKKKLNEAVKENEKKVKDLNKFQEPKETIEVKGEKIEKPEVKKEKVNGKFTTETKSNLKEGLITVKNIDNKEVSWLDYSIISEGEAKRIGENTKPGVYLEQVNSIQPGGAKEAFLEFYNKYKDKDIFITPTTDKGSKVILKELGINIESRIKEGESISETLKRPRKDYRLTDSDKKKIDALLSDERKKS
jgi:hypothetical protein